MKIALSIMLVIVLAVLGVFGYYYNQFEPDTDPEFGVSFSIPHAQYLGFDWKTLYLDMLNDLKPKKLRLMAYWEMIEPEQNQFHFQFIDEMLVEAGKRSIDVTLVLGHKQPRWPECHHPYWYERLDNTQKNGAQLNMIRQAVNHFKQFDAIKMWQVENEPFFEFGYYCGKIPADLVSEEVAIVKGADSRPVVLTDSGEQGNWVATTKLGADVFGATMYREVYSPKFGYYKYPLPAVFFRAKAGWLTKSTEVNKIIGVELQIEPWFTKDINDTPVSEQLNLMNPKVFAEHLDFARRSGYSEHYLWGVEWWYWLAKKQNDWGMWEMARQVFSEQ